MRRVFFSFYWDDDVWRVNQVRNSWVTQGNYETAGFVDAAKIETLKRSTDLEIANWIDQQLQNTSVTCVLIGSQTSRRDWVKYEIQQSIERTNGLLGVYIHNVKDEHGNISMKGEDPFAALNRQFFHNIYPRYYLYDWVDHNGYANLGNWIEEAATQAYR